jgi:hypothetical protein
VDIPSASVREHVSHDGLLRDPQVDAIALRYWRFCSEQIADTILAFGRSAQERIQKRVPLGAFYGYILEHAQGRLVSEGHLSGHRLLLSQEIDFLVAPGDRVTQTEPMLSLVSWRILYVFCCRGSQCFGAVRA